MAKHKRNHNKVSRNITGSMPTTNRNYKDTIFRMLFSDRKNLLSLYNEHIFSEGGFLAPMALAALPSDKQPSSCVGCRSCEAVCPQQIKISEVMSDFADKLKA